MCLQFKTAAPAAFPTEVPAEAAPENKSAADAGPEAGSFDPSDPDPVLIYYSTRNEEMYGSYAFRQLDTEGKKVRIALPAEIFRKGFSLIIR